MNHGSTALGGASHYAFLMTRCLCLFRNKKFIILINVGHKKFNYQSVFSDRSCHPMASRKMCETTNWD